MNRLLVHLYIAFGCALIGACNLASVSKDQGTVVEDQLKLICQQYAPDSRDHKYEVQLSAKSGSGESDSFHLTGYTTRANAVKTTQALIDSLELPIASLDIVVLPDSNLGQALYGLIKVSVANLRSEPGHSQELATQLLHGTPVRLLLKQDNWYLVRCPDNYLAWLSHGEVTPVSKADLDSYLSSNLHMYRGANHIVRTSERGEILLSLTEGMVLNVVGDLNNRFTRVRLVDGREGVVANNRLLPFADWSDRSNETNPLTYIELFKGEPYLWGGTSSNGMDCSGFTKMCFWLDGFVIPRDASQQVRYGQAIQIDDELSALLPNDLLFFGNLREDGSQRITHVGIYQGEGRFIHAGADNGHITSQSLFPDDPDFAAHRRASLLTVKRYTSESEGIIPVSEVFAATFWE